MRVGQQKFLHHKPPHRAWIADLLEEVLRRFALARLWAATGWFRGRFQKSFPVPHALLNRMAEHRPRSLLYAERSQRGGTLVRRWNLILPQTLLSPEEISS